MVTNGTPWRPNEGAATLAQLEARAKALAVSGPEDEAKHVNLAILERDDANLGALRRLGKIAKDRGEGDAAIVYYRRALEIDPTDTIARNQLDRLSGGPVRTTPERINAEAIRKTMESLLKDVRLAPATGSGPVDVDWPTGTEHYPEGWDIQARVGDRAVTIRHVLGHRVAYGRLRRRTLTLVGGTVEVEGVGADDYARTRGLLSLLRHPSGTHVRSQAELPGGYDGFLLVWHHQEILEPGSPQSLAVKLLEDDVEGWASHALLRAAGRQRL